MEAAFCMKTIIYLFFSLFFLGGCQHHEKVAKKSHMDSVLIELSNTPDSLRTPEQKETIRKIQLMVAKYVELKDGVFSFTVPKDDFVEKTGLDIQYYDVVIKNMEDNNAMADQMNFKEAEASFNAMKERILKENQ